MFYNQAFSFSLVKGASGIDAFKSYIISHFSLNFTTENPVIFSLNYLSLSPIFFFLKSKRFRSNMTRSRYSFNLCRDDYLTSAPLYSDIKIFVISVTDRPVQCYCSKHFQWLGWTEILTDRVTACSYSVLNKFTILSFYFHFLFIGFEIQEFSVQFTSRCKEYLYVTIEKIHTWLWMDNIHLK